MKRYEALKIISENIAKNDLVFSTTGMISRELFTIGDRPQNFYLLGSMGLATPVALGLAMVKSKRKIVAIEGDGSMLLNLGVIPLVSALKNKNFLLVVLDNEVYASTGGQPTISKEVNLEKIALGAGFLNVKKAKTKKMFEVYLQQFLKTQGPSFLLAKVGKSQLEKTPRISLAPQAIKERFIDAL